MLFHKKLYFDGKMLKSKRKVIKKIKHGKLQLGVHVIALAENGTDLLEIYPLYVLLQKEYKESNMMIVGIASDMDSAVEMVSKIVMDCLEIMGTVAVKDFFTEEI